MEWRKLVLPLSGRYSSRTKRGFVSRAANPTSFTGTKFIQPPLACRHPLWPCGPASHFYKGLVSDLGSSPYLMWWAFRSPVRIGNEVSSVGWKKKSLPHNPVCSLLPSHPETNIYWDEHQLWERALAGLAAMCKSLEVITPSPYFLLWENHLSSWPP